jgi:type VI secretion system secreted protein Hcp
MRRSGFKGLVAAGVVATGMLASSSIVAASDMFLKMDGVRGESTDEKHKGEIDVLSWSWGTSNGAGQIKSGRVPTACIQDLNLTKQTDSSTPTLIINGVTGQIAPTAVLVVRKSGGDSPIEFLKLTMRNVMVSSYQTGASEGASDRPFEQVVLHFESMLGEYQRQGADGLPLGDPITWDITGGGCK